LPGKRALDLSAEIEVVVVDVAESPIERSEKKQKRFFSGKKKRHAIKTPVRVGRHSKPIIDIRFAKRTRQDFSRFRNTAQPSCRKQLSV